MLFSILAFIRVKWSQQCSLAQVHTLFKTSFVLNFYWIKNLERASDCVAINIYTVRDARCFILIGFIGTICDHASRNMNVLGVEDNKPVTIKLAFRRRSSGGGTSTCSCTGCCGSECRVSSSRRRRYLAGSDCRLSCCRGWNSLFHTNHKLLYILNCKTYQKL